MKIVIIAAILLLAAGVDPTDEIKLDIGSTLPAGSVPKKNDNLYMTHPTKSRPFIETNIAGIKYQIAYEEKTRIIKYISTYDSRFKSAAGLQIGSYIEVKADQVEVFPGWEIRGPLDEDGWQPLIGFDGTMTIFDGIEELDITLKQQRLESDKPVKTKIMAFVKGGN